MNNLIIISFWYERSISPLFNLLSQIRVIKSGDVFDVLIVCNADSNLDNFATLSELENLNVKYLIRENTGFNIGAWDYGWRNFPNYDYYLFLQDDCFIVRPLWLKAFVDKFYQSPQIGLLGESLNWKCSWEELAQSSYNQIHRDHMLGGKPIKRIDLYRQFLMQNQIPEQETADHLQSIILFTSRSILEKIDGFIIGKNYGEAIASEIAISKKVQALGYQIQSVNPNSCYHYIAHPQWFKRKRRIERWIYAVRSTLSPIYAQAKDN
ncbi:MAG: hypothetical protein F6K61_21225 [Sphaerospermopsis sp. SIO1G1]|nr:hypothetical protein [Sphaerospermopsis sp. SIO1G1]